MTPLLSRLLSRLLSDSPRPFRRPPRRRDARRRLAARLRVEVLEDRTVPTAVAAPSGLVSWWTGNGTANDVMGLNNATPTGLTYATGEVGQAFSFDGTDDRAQIVDNPSLQFTTSLSIEGWVQVNGFPTGTNGDDHGEIFFRGDDRSGLDPYSLSVEPNGTLNFQVTNASNASASVAAPIATGQLIHVAATLDDATGTMSLYENGVVVAQEVTAIRPFQNLDPTQNPSIAIGNHGGYPNSPHNFPFNGLIDELAVYNRALTPGEVLGLYKAGSSGKVLSPISVDDPSVVNGSGPVTFTITRTNTSGSLTVNWTTADDTATAGTDYVAASGAVTFADGQATQTVTVTTLNDTTPEPTEDFELIATPAGGTSVMGVGSILTDNTSISVSGASAVEGSNTLKFLDHFVSPGSGGLSTARSSVFGPDGNLYVASASTNAILRYDPTGEFLGAFVPSASGGLSTPWDLAFGPDGDLYVSSSGNGEVLRYDGSTGAFLNVVASGLSTPAGLTFGPDGSLYIANEGTNEVLRYNSSGLSSFVTAGSGGLSQPRKAVFGPDGNLYVASQGTGQILRYNGQTGAFIGVFASMRSSITGTGAMWLGFGTDGYLYVTARASSSSLNVSILRFNATTGTFVDSFALGRDGWSFNLGPGNIVYDSSNGDNTGGGFVDRIGPSSIAAFTVSLAWPSATPTTVSYATADGTALAGRDYTATSGTLTFAPGETSKGILVPTLDDGTADPTRAFTVSLSNPSGGVITNGQGIGTILDDTKFYVVDGGSSDSTYQYAVTGGALASSALGSGDTAPRGVATTAAGTTEWVVDANKTVYVYNTAGTLLGSWSAGGLSASATLTGIATNGTDIWLVDSYTDKVYRYAGAASLLSGSQSAASSFSLAGGKNGDPNPQDLVTDGTSFWVVDGTKLKVFKYTLSGSLLGSWSIDPADAHPTGITINPSNVSDVWIVDSGTHKVYQYVGAASRTSGSQTAAASFALAAGNTNPQGIADPPTADQALPPAASPTAPNSPAAAALGAVAAVGPPAGGGAAPVVGRDAVFALLFRESLPEPAVGFLAAESLPAHADSPAPAAGGAWTLAGAPGGDAPREPLTSPAGDSGRGFGWERGSMGLPDGPFAVEDGPALVGATDSSPAETSEDPAADE
jgi:streptogramin lyase